jgi:hypothetical protein
MILILNVFNGQKSSKFVIMVLKIYTFDYNLGSHEKICSFYYNVNHVWFQY